jgi:hypothetical protein
MWAVVYENGMSLTIASEQTARSLAQAERDRGRAVSVRRVDDVVTHPRCAEEAARQADSLPEPELIRRAAEFARPEPISEREPTSAPEPVQVVEAIQVVEPVQAMTPVQARPAVPAAEPASIPEPASNASPYEPAREIEPTRAPTPARRRRLPLYVLAAAVIVVAAALANHWDVLPRLGANTSSSPTHVSRHPRPPRLLPPLGQPPVMHFGSALVQPDRLYLPHAHGPRRLRASVGRPSTIARGG